MSVLNMFKSQYDFLFLDLLCFKYKNTGVLTTEDYNSAQRITVDFLNSGVFKEYIDGTYTLAKLKDVDHYVMMNTLDNSILDNLYIDSDGVNELDDKYNMYLFEPLQELSSKVSEMIYDENESFFSRRNKYFKSCHKVEPFLTEDDNKLKAEFFLSEYASVYQYNVATKSLKSLLHEKLGQEQQIEISHDLNFSDHYERIKNSIINPYPEFNGKDNEFYKKTSFIANELNFKYISPSYKTANTDIGHNDVSWIYVKHDNKYSGGSVIMHDIASEVREISLKTSIRNKNNYLAIINSIIENSDTQKDLFIMHDSVHKYSLNDELRKNNKNKRIYYSRVEKDMFYDLYGFMAQNKLYDYSDKIFDSFYKNIILKNQFSTQEELFDSEKPELLVKAFKEKLMITYKDIIQDRQQLFETRKDFIQHCYLKDEGNDYLDYFLQYSFHSTNLAFSMPSEHDINYDIQPLIEKVKSFVEDQFGPLNDDQEEDLYHRIKANYQISYEYGSDSYHKEFSYHALYDYLTDNKFIIPKNNDIVKAYRFEMADGSGPYKGNIDGKDLMDQSSYQVFNYAQRKEPIQDREISTLFIDTEGKGMLKNNYKEKYIFGFTNKKQLESWFTQKEIENFKNNNMKLCLYEFYEKDAIATNIQVAFRKNYYLSKKEISFDEFFDFKKENKVKLKL